MELHSAYRVYLSLNNIITSLNFMTKTFAERRKDIYDSIGRTKYDFIRLRNSTLSSTPEKEKIDKIIEALDALKAEFYTPRDTKTNLL